MTAAFIDSGAFIAFLDASDRSHDAVVALFDDPPARWATSAYVVAETYSWFLRRLGEGKARRFRMLLDDLDGIEIFDSSPQEREATAARLDLHRGRKLTWVDAASLVMLDVEEISVVWGTDRQLAIEGATVVPGPP